MEHSGELPAEPGGCWAEVGAGSGECPDSASHSAANPNCSFLAGPEKSINIDFSRKKNRYLSDVEWQFCEKMKLLSAEGDNHFLCDFERKNR